MTSKLSSGVNWDKVRRDAQKRVDAQARVEKLGKRLLDAINEAHLAGVAYQAGPAKPLAEHSMNACDRELEAKERYLAACDALRKIVQGL